MAALSNLVTTDTFRTWYTRTNEIINRLNTKVMVGDEASVNGAFSLTDSATTSFSYGSKFSVNSSLILIRANTTLAANVTVSSNTNVFNMAAGTLILQPINGTTVNSAITVNALSTFLANVTVNASVATTGTVAVTGNVSVNGTFTHTGGALITRQVLYTAANTVAANTLASPQYDDFNPTGFAECQILNLTPNIDAVITGFQAPSITDGARILFIQNLSTTYKVTLASANTSSVANNRIKTPGDSNFDILPGAAATLIWAFQNKQWRTLSAAQSTGAQTFGNTTVNGTLSVSSTTTLQGNTAAANITSNGTITTPLLTVSQTATIANAIVSGNASFSANVTVTSVLKVSGTNGRVVLPVGNNLWATA